ncbi:hypothetical protein [Muricoccus pecuniae]|uniref:Uncharacterized protein n=1 Tax=Muricoccus pecuniae TaxID=693023 RepID=A0A840Y733_9PROT|nr:hypothetical protein [Roseomonas pecuniae]MBB5696545.1 hypothetical protein [Roseomonas pecuniae]
MFDLLAAATLCGAAAWVTAAYSLALATSAPGRFLIAASMTLWLGGVLWLGATRVLLDAFWLGLPGLAWAVAVPIAVLVTWLLGTQDGRRRVARAPLPALVAVQSVRVLGIWFVVLHAAGRLPAPFAPVAGWGDILAGVLAVPAAWLALRRPDRGRGAILTWNVIGAVDLIAAVSLGLTSLPGPLRVFMGEPGSGPMNVLPWIVIPGFLVPSLLTLHFVVFHRLRRKPPALGSP